MMSTDQDKAILSKALDIAEEVEMDRFFSFYMDYRSWKDQENVASIACANECKRLAFEHMDSANSMRLLREKLKANA